jgi:FMN phosphatase YigB (HAD superfamily)
MQPVKNIIFDLGGVLMDIDFTLTHKAFEQLGVQNFAALYNQHSADEFFSDFEKGKIPTADFFDHIRHICQCDFTDDAIRNAWNALLIGFLKNGTNGCCACVKNTGSTCSPIPISSTTNLS